MKYVFLDTNYFLHYPPCDQIDWCTLIGEQEVFLVVVPVVIRELNEKKDGKNATRVLQDRARDRLRYLLPLIKGGNKSVIRKNVEIVGIPYDPTIDFTQHKLNKDLPDDWLLASIIQFAQENADADVVLATEDGGLQLKAPAHNIVQVDLPADQRLEDKPDEIEKENRQLKQELAVMKTARPNVSLVFDNEKNFAVLSQSEPEESEVLEEERSWEEEERKRRSERQMSKMFGAGYAVPLPMGAKSHNANYSDELEEYREFLSRTFRVQLFILNDGKVPAEELDITIEFPTQGIVISDELPERPQPAKDNWGVRMPLSSKFLQPIQEFCRLNLSDHTAEYSLKSAKHHYLTRLKPIFVTFEPGVPKFAFSAQFRIICSNLHDPVDGKIHLKI